MRKSVSALVCLGAVFVTPFVLRVNATRLTAWQAGPTGHVTLDLLAALPYVLLALSALWAARIANAPVYVLSLVLIPSQYYFSGGPAPFGGGDQMRFVLFLCLPVLTLLSSFISHRTLSCTWKTGAAVLALGWIAPPFISLVFGRSILSWIGSYRWGAAQFLGAPSSPTIFYLSVLAFHLILPVEGKEGQMKKILAALIPCFYFSGVFRPIFPSGPLYPPGLEPMSFVVFTTLSAALTLYGNFFLSWSKAYVDDLTQVLGRRALNESLGQLSGTYSIAMVDVDHFKKFNDTYGHAAGDVVLREVASILAKNSGGRVYRYGGEEFSVLFPNVDSDTASARMDEVRRLLADTRISLNGAARGGRDKKVSVRISAGVSENGKKYATPEEVIGAADRALYKAKENGRNRVEKA